MVERSFLFHLSEGIAPTHGEEMAKLARFDDATLWKMLEEKKIEDQILRFGKYVIQSH